MSDRSARPYNEFGAWLRSRRLARRWTQEELARRLAYDVSYIRKIEWGERRPSEALRVRVGQALGVPVSSLPGATADAPPGGVPDPTGPLIGRDDALATVADLFDAGARLVTVLGAPGIGKTRLALALAPQLEEKLTVAVRFVPLVGVADAGGVAPAIGQALGLTRSRDDATGIERLVDVLRAQELLLVLDNFEHVVAAAGLVGVLLARVPALRVLVTSRQALGLRLENQFLLPPLAVPRRDGAAGQLAEVPSVALFIDRARRARPAFALDAGNAVDIAEICARLQGIPLAIELAAGSIALLTPKAVVTELGTGLDLPVPGPRDAPRHQRTLRAAIGWSFDLLPAVEKVLMSRLAVFAGGCTLASAAAVCRLPSEDGPEPAPGVLDLAAKSLLEPAPDAGGGTRFASLETVRSFALERLRESGELELMQQRHAAWFLALAREQGDRLKGGWQLDALGVLDAEQDNLRAAMLWALEHDAATAGALCMALWRYWWMRGHVGEGRQWLDGAIAQARPEDDKAAWLRVVAGVLARAQGAFAAADQLCADGTLLARRVGDEPALAQGLMTQGRIAEVRGAFDEATALFEEARRTYDNLGDVRGLGHALNGLAMVLLAREELKCSARRFEDALAIFRDIDDSWSSAIVLANLGSATYRRGEVAAARCLYQQALTLYRRVGDDAGVARSLVSLGIAGRAEGGGEAVEGMFEEALLTYSRLGERGGVADCLSALAVARHGGDPETSVMLLGAAHGLRRSIGAPVPPADERLQAGVRDALRRGLGNTGFDAAWRGGELLEADELVALALTGRRTAPQGVEATHPGPDPAAGAAAGGK